MLSPSFGGVKNLHRKRKDSKGIIMLTSVKFEISNSSFTTSYLLNSFIYFWVATLGWLWLALSSRSRTKLADTKDISSLGTPGKKRKYQSIRSEWKCPILSKSPDNCALWLLWCWSWWELLPEVFPCCYWKGLSSVNFVNSKAGIPS